MPSVVKPTTNRTDKAERTNSFPTFVAAILLVNCTNVSEMSQKKKNLTIFLICGADREVPYRVTRDMGRSVSITVACQKPHPPTRETRQ